MQSLVVQLLLKTGTFSTDLKQAKGQIQSFQKGCSTAGKSLDAFGKAIGIDIGALTKFGGAIGAAVLAGKALKGILESNQTTADTFAGVIYSAKTVVGEFATAIGTFDFSNFNDGLGNLISRARDAYDAIDQLANTVMSYDVKSAKANAAISAARAVINNPDSTPEQVKAAQEQMKNAIADLKSASEVLMNDYVDAMVAEVGAAGAKIQGEGAVEILDKWLEVNTTKGREAIKAQAKAGYEEYQKELKALNARTSTTIQGAPMYGQQETTVRKAGMEDVYQKEKAALDERYKDEITWYVLLEKYSDEELKKLGQQRVAMIRTGQTVDDLTNQMERVNKKAAGSGSGGGGSKTPKVVTPEPDEGSLNWYKKMEQSATTLRDNAVKGSEDWVKANKLVIESQQKIKEIQEENSTLEQGSLAYWEKIKSDATTTMNAVVEGSEKWVDADKKVKEAEAEIEKIQNNRKGIQEGSSAAMNEIITKLQTELALIAMGTQEWKDKKAKLDSYIASLDQMTAAATKEANQKKLNDLLAIDNKTIGDIQQIVSLLKEARNTMSASDTEGLKAFDAKIAYWEKKAESFEYKAPDTSSWDEFNKAMSNTSTIVSSLTNTFKEGSEVTAASILSMVATALPAIGSLISSISALTAVESVEAGVAAVGKAVSSSKHWIEAIAAVASLGAVVAAALASAKKVNTPSRYASGGIVGGSSYTGDRVTAQVNSGEMILNKQQQARLFKIANGDGGSAIRGGDVTFHISGTDLVGVLNNQTRKNRVIR